MDIEVIKKLIRKYQPGHSEFVVKALQARNYYENKTDILFPDLKKKKEQEEKPLRNADNRIPFNFHGLLVNQKASYMFTAPPLFDLGSKAANKSLTKFLGDKYAKVCKDLCIDASNCTIGWLHLWKDNVGSWKYAIVPAEQIIPVWSKSLEKKLLGVLRTYPDIDEDTGDSYTVYEYWNDKECAAYRLKAGDELEQLKPYPMFMVDPELCEMSEVYQHVAGEVPFFPFFNNNINANDLANIKPLIDTYCKVFSGFVNDLEDIQEIIFVLTNYGGADLGEFMRDLKNYKAIQIESEGEGDHSGVSTLTIELPVEAREKLLTITRKCIFEQGMGIDPDPVNFGNSSGVALGFLYSLLELKAGLQETEFKLGFGRFIRCICRLMKIPIKDDVITQTWTRTSVKNDLELSQIAQQSVGVISQETIIAHHPWVEDPEGELARIEKQKQKELEQADPYYEAFQQKPGQAAKGGVKDGKESK
jgi:SPP1 family phage portal protein